MLQQPNDKSFFRVLQAVARDNLFPGLSSFGTGSGRNDDPVRGYVLVFGVSLACVLVGKSSY